MTNKINAITFPISKLKVLISETYHRSTPVGMGIIHFIPGHIPQETLETLAKDIESKHKMVSMDYVHGRQCKMTIWLVDDETIGIRTYWPDHTQEEFKALIEAVNNAV